MATLIERWSRRALAPSSVLARSPRSLATASSRPRFRPARAWLTSCSSGAKSSESLRGTSVACCLVTSRVGGVDCRGVVVPDGRAGLIGGVSRPGACRDAAGGGWWGGRAGGTGGVVGAGRGGEVGAVGRAATGARVGSAAVVCGGAAVGAGAVTEAGAPTAGGGE